jgi:hypothetical protein
LTGPALFIFAARVHRARFLEEARRFDAKARRLEMIKAAMERRKVKAS